MKTKRRLGGPQFGPEPHQFDPYDGTSGKEFEAEVVASTNAAKLRQKASRSSCQRHSSSAHAQRPSVAAFHIKH